MHPVTIPPETIDSGEVTTMRISKRVAEIRPSMTLAVSAKAKAMKAAGVDVVGFGAGEPDFRTPDPVCEAGVRAIRDGHHGYIVPSSGLSELKAAVADYLRRRCGLAYEPAQIIITCGGKHALFEACLAVLEPGDEAVLPAPYWVSYPEMIRFAEAREVIVAAGAEAGFKMTPEQLAAAITKRTRLVILNSPSNPTGIVYTRDELAALADVVAGRDIWIFSDEIYNELVYDSVKTCAFALARDGLTEQTVTFGGASKTWAMTGWRIGWAAGPENLIQAMGNLQSQSTSNPASISQYAALEAVSGSQETVAKMREEFDRRRLYMLDRLSGMPGVHCVRPQGAFYCFPDVSATYDRVLGRGAEEPKSAAFATRVLEETHVAVVPGAAFGDDNCVRLSFAASMEQIEKGLDRLEEFLSA
ncbi:MAG TPA: pyridoxal phosphate-dependent aminotransferase [Phycisphaerae bacterium]|nr:pyridoxal phosphate-dependent aminotransferase [Phycisphaerae bacterium]